jgi:hypothetical protein
MGKGPRKAGKRGEAGARYAALKAKWEARRRDPEHAGGGDWLVDKPALSLDAAPFLSTLRVLGEATQDRRFAELHKTIMQSGLVDRSTGHWSRHGVPLANPLTTEIFERIDELIAGGMSERLAIAEAAAEFVIAGNSFEAACLRLRRMLIEFRKLVRQKRR